MPSKADWCAAVQVRKDRSHSFDVRGTRMLVCLVRAGRNVAMYWVSPRNPQTFVAVSGLGQCTIQLIFSGLADMPEDEIMWPRNVISVEKSVLFLVLQARLAV